MAQPPEERLAHMWRAHSQNVLELARLTPPDLVKSLATALATIAAEREDAAAIDADHGKTKKRKHT